MKSEYMVVFIIIVGVVFFLIKTGVLVKTDKEKSNSDGIYFPIPPVKSFKVLKIYFEKKLDEDHFGNFKIIHQFSNGKDFINITLQDTKELYFKVENFRRSLDIDSKDILYQMKGANSGVPARLEIKNVGVQGYDFICTLEYMNFRYVFSDY